MYACSAPRSRIACSHGSSTSCASSPGVISQRTARGDTRALVTARKRIAASRSTGRTDSRVPGIAIAPWSCRKPRTQASGTSTFSSNRPPTSPRVCTASPSAPIRNVVSRLDRISASALHSQRVKSTFVVPVTTSPIGENSARSMIAIPYAL